MAYRFDRLTLATDAKETRSGYVSFDSRCYVTATKKDDKMNLTPICPYCKQFSKEVTGKEVYPHRKDLFSLSFYSCVGCDAYVGTHKGTTKPLGRLANKELRKAKSAAHRAFDPLWKFGDMKRKEAYKWLAETLNITPSDCHIGMFNVEMCEDVEMHSLNKQEELASHGFY